MEIGDYVDVRSWKDYREVIHSVAIETTQNVILYEISGMNFITMVCDEVDAHVINEVNLDANFDNFTRYLLHRGLNFDYYFKRFDRGVEKFKSLYIANGNGKWCSHFAKTVSSKS